MMHQVLSFILSMALVGGPDPAAPTASAIGRQSCLRLCEQETATIQNRECLLREEELAKRALDAEVAAVTESSAGRPDVLTAFNDTQKAWIAYYTADCAAVALNWAGGSGQRNASAFCRVDHIRRRAFDIWLSYHLESLPEPGLVCNDLRPDA
jgi:uncharacterized protein YecT (DUF1311 family)